MEGLNDLFEDDLGLDDVVEQDKDDLFATNDTGDDIFVQKPELTGEDSIISEFLKLKGIQNNKITIVDDNNNQEEIDFFSLSKEEQLEILNSNVENEQVDYGLEESEINFLNSLRTENKSVQQFLDEYKATVLAEAGTGAEPSYDIDAYSDEELFLLDLKTKYELTDAELEKELEKELQDKDLFLKKVNKTREEYKKLEDNYKEEQQQEFTKQREQEYQGFVNTMVDVAVKNPELYGIELDQTEQNEVLSLLLDLDDKGASEFYKKLNDPTVLYQAAWFVKYGKEAFDAIKDAYEAEIAQLKKDKPKVVVQRKDNKEKNINDLF